MGDFFGGGGGEAPPGYYQTPPNPGGNIPTGDTITGIMAGLLEGLVGPSQTGYRTAQYGANDWDPQTMAMHIPQFSPQAGNGWIPQSPMQFPLGAYSYVPPGAHSMFNPQGNYGASNQMQGIPPFNPMAQNMTVPDYMGPYGPGGQQPPQGQHFQPPQQKPPSLPDNGGMMT